MSLSISLSPSLDCLLDHAFICPICFFVYPVLPAECLFCLSICVGMPSVHPCALTVSIFPSVCPSMYLTHLSSFSLRSTFSSLCLVCPSCWSFMNSFHPSVHPSVCCPSLHLICVSVCLYARLSVHVLCISVHLCVPPAYPGPPCLFFFSTYPFCPLFAHTAVHAPACLSVLLLSRSILAPSVCPMHSIRLSCALPLLVHCVSLCLPGAFLSPVSPSPHPSALYHSPPCPTLLQPLCPGLSARSPTPPPQGLCTACSHCLGYSSLRKPHGSSPTSFKSLFKKQCLLSELLPGHPQHFPCFNFLLSI